MADQLDHLAQMAQHPKIELRIMPLDAQVFSAAFGAFELFRSPDSPTPYMVVTEDRNGGNYHDRVPDVEAHIQLFDFLRDTSLPPTETIDLIETAAKEHYR
jgi:hypothetical protein